jgi:hypothetical protein
MPLFCRHNRLTANCPICGPELNADLAAKAPPRDRPARVSAKPRAASASRAGGRRGGVVTTRMARAVDDGYRTPLAPGLRATADAERLAGALAAAAERLEPPGPYEQVARESHDEQATWLAFLLALGGADAPERREALLEAAPTWEDEAAALPEWAERPVAAYRAWARRSGSQAAGITGEPDWTPERRFARAFERLALPGFNRAARFDMLAVLGAAERYPLRADTLGLGLEEDATSVAAKRLLQSGDRMLLERRAHDLAEAGGVPLAALDRGLAVWDAPGAHVDLATEIPGALRAALGLR